MAGTKCVATLSFVWDFVVLDQWKTPVILKLAQKCIWQVHLPELDLVMLVYIYGMWKTCSTWQKFFSILTYYCKIGYFSVSILANGTIGYILPYRIIFRIKSVLRKLLFSESFYFILMIFTITNYKTDNKYEK